MSHKSICRWVANIGPGSCNLKMLLAKVALYQLHHKLAKYLKKDGRFTVRQLVRLTNLSLARVHCTLKKYVVLK